MIKVYQLYERSCVDKKVINRVRKQGTELLRSPEMTNGGTVRCQGTITIVKIKHNKGCGVGSPGQASAVPDVLQGWAKNRPRTDASYRSL